MSLLLSTGLLYGSDSDSGDAVTTAVTASALMINKTGRDGMIGAAAAATTSACLTAPPHYCGVCAV